jgi:hypothetical protein
METVHIIGAIVGFGAFFLTIIAIIINRKINGDD